MQSVPITTNVVSLNPAHGEVCSIQHYVIKCVSDLMQVSGFLWVLLVLEGQGHSDLIFICDTPPCPNIYTNVHSEQNMKALHLNTKKVLSWTRLH